MDLYKDVFGNRTWSTDDGEIWSGSARSGAGPIEGAILGHGLAWVNPKPLGRLLASLAFSAEEIENILALASAYIEGLPWWYDYPDHGFEVSRTISMGRVARLGWNGLSVDGEAVRPL